MLFAFLRRCARLLLQVLYGYRVHGAAGLAAPGPMLLTPNHVSWLDWLLVGLVLDDSWKFVTSSTTARLSPVHRWIMVNRRTFPVDPTSAYAVRDMAEYLQRGGKLVLFPEGRISMTGVLMKVYEGTGFLIHKSGARVVTAYLRNGQRVPWVRHAGWTSWFPRVSVHFSAPLQAPAWPDRSAMESRRRTTTWLRDQLVRQQFEVEMQWGPATLPAALAEAARHQPGKVVLEDATFTPLSYRRIGAATQLLAGQWRQRLRATPEGRVGVLLPNVNALPLVVFSLWRVGRVPTLLNYSSGLKAMLAGAELAGLRQVITARAFLERVRIDPLALTEAGLELLYVEEVRAAISGGARVAAVLAEVVRPGRRLERAPVRADDTAVVLFTSGSEGQPKGVELTHRNLLANVRQATAMFDLQDDDRFFNALPLFHSFGLMAGTLFPLIRGCYTFLYPSPLHYRVVPTLVYERNCTVLLGTNTFLHGYARKAHPYDFRSLRYLVAGAEKVTTATFDTWARKFGVCILEGYGATECSPVVALNHRVDHQLGAAGRFVPGLDYRLEPVEGVTTGGRLFVRGPNVMKGYLNAEANARFCAHDGWYDTGDIARVDDEGFVHLLGRLKRFAKVSGEMVSLTAIEEALEGAFPAWGPRSQIVVLAVPDADKGEKLIACTNDARVTLGDVRAAVRARGLSNLCAPRELRCLATLPKLGTGKTDYRALAALLGPEGA